MRRDKSPCFHRLSIGSRSLSSNFSSRGVVSPDCIVLVPTFLPPMILYLVCSRGCSAIIIPSDLSGRPRTTSFRCYSMVTNVAPCWDRPLAYVTKHAAARSCSFCCLPLFSLPTRIQTDLANSKSRTPYVY